MSKFQIFTDTASDMPTQLRKDNNIDYFRMGLVINDKEIKAEIFGEVELKGKSQPMKVYALIPKDEPFES